MLKETGREQTWHEWLPEPNLIEAIALCHDLGHPPFGHGGEVALNFAMRDAGGFEGNGQTLRLLSLLEAHTEGHGLDLTRRSLLGVLKYPVAYERVVRRERPDSPASLTQLRRDDWKPPKCYMATEERVVAWIMEPFGTNDRDLLRSAPEPTEHKHAKPKYCAFDTSIMEVADDIAYGVHDFEDAIALRMVDRDDWNEAAKYLSNKWADDKEIGSAKTLSDELFGSSAARRKHAIGGLVNALITSVVVEHQPDFEHPLLKHRARLATEARQFLDWLMKLVRERVIHNPQVQTLEYRGQQLVVRLFEALKSDPERLLKPSFKEQLPATGEVDRSRVICDYIAGMTDEYATRMFERLFVPRQGQFSDRL